MEKNNSKILDTRITKKKMSLELTLYHSFLRMFNQITGDRLITLDSFNHGRNSILFLLDQTYTLHTDLPFLPKMCLPKLLSMHLQNIYDIWCFSSHHQNSPGASQVELEVKYPPVNAGNLRDSGSIPGLRSYPGVGNCILLQQFWLENPMGKVDYSP